MLETSISVWGPAGAWAHTVGGAAVGQAPARDKNFTVEQGGATRSAGSPLELAMAGLAVEARAGDDDAIGPLTAAQLGWRLLTGQGGVAVGKEISTYLELSREL